jgi:hypothetical protein
VADAAAVDLVEGLSGIEVGVHVLEDWFFDEGRILLFGERGEKVPKLSNLYMRTKHEGVPKTNDNTT